MSYILRIACLVSCSITQSQPGVAFAAGKSPATLLVNDSLASPNQTVTVEARLMSPGPAAPVGLGGEPVELVVYGKVVATAVTGEDGTVRLPFMPKAQGVIPVQVRVGEKICTECNARVAIPTAPGDNPWSRRGDLWKPET